MARLDICLRCALTFRDTIALWGALLAAEDHLPQVVEPWLCQHCRRYRRLDDTRIQSCLKALFWYENALRKFASTYTGSPTVAPAFNFFLKRCSISSNRRACGMMSAASASGTTTTPMLSATTMFTGETATPAHWIGTLTLPWPVMARTLGNDALAEHGEAELADPFDVSARTVDDGLFSDDHLVPRYLNQVSLYTRNGSAFHIRLGEGRLQ